jgi:hypothetical protein
MHVELDIEIERARLRRWREEDARENLRLLREAWRAIARSHALLDGPVLGVERRRDAPSPRVAETVGQAQSNRRPARPAAKVATPDVSSAP